MRFMKGKKPFECNICDSKYYYSSQLKKHMDEIHEGKKPFECNLCDSKYYYSSQLKKHISTNHNEKQ